MKKDWVAKIVEVVASMQARKESTLVDKLRQHGVGGTAMGRSEILYAQEGLKMCTICGVTIPALIVDEGSMEDFAIVESDVSGIQARHSRIRRGVVYGVRERIQGSVIPWPETLKYGTVQDTGVFWSKKAFVVDEVATAKIQGAHVLVPAVGVVEVKGCRARGVCVRGSRISDVVCWGADLSAVDAREVIIEGRVVIQDCDVDGMNLGGYRIEEGSVLEVSYTERGRVWGIRMGSAGGGQGGVRLRHLACEESVFSLASGESVLGLLALENVVFRQCDFTHTRIDLRGAERVELVCEACTLVGSVISGVRGNVVLRGCEVGLEVVESELEELVVEGTGGHTERMKLALKNCSIVAPRMENVQVQCGEWDNVLVRTGAGKKGTLRGSMYKDLPAGALRFEIEGSLDLSHTTFRGCDLSGLRLKKCILQGTRFIDCNLSGVVWDEAERLEEIEICGQKTVLCETRLQGLHLHRLRLVDVPNEALAALDCCTAEFVGSLFCGLQMKGWRAMQARFKGCTFKNCFMTGTLVANAQFTEDNGTPCRLEGVTWDNEKFEDVDFENIEVDAHTTLRGGQFVGCRFGCATLFGEGGNYNGSKFERCRWEAEGRDMRTMQFDQIEMICKSTLTECDLRDVRMKCVLKNVRLYGCELSGVKLEGEAMESVLVEGGRFDAMEVTARRCCKMKFMSARKGAWGRLYIGKNEYVEGLKVEDAHVKELVIEGCKEVSNVLIKKVITDRLLLADVKIMGLNCDELSSIWSEWRRVTVDDGVKLETCDLRESRWDGGNMLCASAHALRNVRFDGAHFVGMRITGDIQAYHRNHCSFTEAEFDRCDFVEANVSGVNFSGCTFTSTCDLREVRTEEQEHRSRIEAAVFDDAVMLANMDGVVLKACKCRGTRFGEESTGATDAQGGTVTERRMYNTVFDQCEFSRDTSFAGVRLEGDEGRPQLLIPGIGFDDLRLEYVRCVSMTLANYEGQKMRDVTFERCTVRECALREPCGELRITEESRMEHVRIEGGTWESEQLNIAHSELTDVQCVSCAFKKVLFSEVVLRRVRFEKCRLSQVRCTKGVVYSVTFSKGETVAQGDEALTCLIEDVRFTDALLPGTKGREVVIAFEGYQAGEVKKFHLSYYSDQALPDEITRELLRLGIEDSQRLGAEQKWYESGYMIPCERSCEILRKALEEPLLNALRHMERGELGRQELVACRDELQEFLRKMRQYGLVEPSTPILEEGTNTLIKCILKRADDEEVTLGEMLEAINKWEECTLVRLYVPEREAKSKKRVDLEKWLTRRLKRTGLQAASDVGEMPRERIKIYADFGVWGDILRRIAINAADHGKVTEVKYRIGLTPRHEVQVNVWDEGGGFKYTREAMKGWMEDARLGQLLVWFGKKYCSEIRLRTVMADGTQGAWSMGRRGVREIGHDKWFPRGTVYEFFVELPQQEHSNETERNVNERG